MLFSSFLFHLIIVRKGAIYVFVQWNFFHVNETMHIFPSVEMLFDTAENGVFSTWERASTSHMIYDSTNPIY